MKTQASIAAAFVLLGGLVAQAHATPIISLSDGTTTKTLADGDIGDWNGAAGAVTFIGSVGIWSVNVSTGYSKPLLGSADQPALDLSSSDLSLGAGTLEIMLTDTGFTHDGLVSAAAAIGGTTHGSISYRTYYDASNTAFGMANLLTDLGPLGGAFSSGTGTSTSFDSTLYSLTLVVDITHRGLDLSSFDAEMKVPEPASVALLGVGLLALGFFSFGRRRTQPQERV